MHSLVDHDLVLMFETSAEQVCFLILFSLVTRLLQPYYFRDARYSGQRRPILNSSLVPLIRNYESNERGLHILQGEAWTVQVPQVL